MNNLKILPRVTVLVLLMISFALGQNTVGLLMNGVEASPGYTLFAPTNSNSTYLIDNDGLLVHEWTASYAPALTVYLLEDGSLLRATKIPSDSSDLVGGFQKHDWDGQLIWEFYIGTQHHDIEPLPNGNVLVVSTDLQSVDSSIAEGRDSSTIAATGIRSLSIFEIKQTAIDSGEIVWEWHAWDHLIQDFDSTKANFGDVSQHPELADLNFGGVGGEAWLHTNSVAYNAKFDQIAVSNRASDDLWIIDHSTTSVEAASHQGGNSGRGGDILYRWGNPASYRAGTVDDKQLFAQHDVQWVPEGSPGAGNILAFNNGLDRPDGTHSSVIEIVLPVDSFGAYTLNPGAAFEPSTPAWEFVSDSTYLFSAGRFGGTQRLPNGNTLICSPLDGRFFEVTPEKQTVWIYVNPVNDLGAHSQGEEPVKNSVFRSNRYPLDYAGLSGKDLTPGDPIELYPTTIAANKLTPDQPVLFANYPNPFNPSTTISYTLTEQAMVKLVVYDIRGQEITKLQNVVAAPGRYEIPWAGEDQAGTSVSAGVYFARLQAGSIVETIKMIYLP